MDKYRRVPKVKETEAKPENEIRVTAVGSVSAYVSFAAKVFNEMSKDELIVKATGNALAKAVTLTEVIKRRFKGLHQITALSTQEIIDEYEPLEEGLEKVIDKRNVAYLEIKLSKKDLDTKAVGYQAPIDESLVTEYDAEEMTRSRGRGRGRGRGKGRGKGKGRGGKGSSKGKSKDGSKGKSPKGKSKGKSDKGKGKSGGKGKSSKGYDDRSKGKGKSTKGKSSYSSWSDGYSRGGKGKSGKGKGGGYNQSSWGGGWDNSWSDWGGYSSGGYGRSKGGKSKGYW